MNKTIGVEHNLTPVMEYLSEKGYKVESIDLGNEYSRNIDRFDAVVVTGMNKDFLGVQDRISSIPVIEAKGLTAEQVYDRIANSIQQ
jgi:hypothetical protein